MTKIVSTLLIVSSMSVGARAESPTFEFPRCTIASPLARTIGVRDAMLVTPIAPQFDARHDRAFVTAQTPPSRRVRHPVLLGAAIGAGTGFVLNASACRTGESVCTAAGNLMMAGIGAGVGAVVGWLVGGR